MLRFGTEPSLECSSKGDKRFSAFFARIRFRNNKTIEELYQARKVFRVDGELISGLSIKEAKGKKATNLEDLKDFYQNLWWEYFQENPDLYHVIKEYRGFSDIFGQEGHNCQAESIYNIRMMMDRW